MLRLAHSSVANQAIIPLQDILDWALKPGEFSWQRCVVNWGWRYQSAALTAEVRDRRLHRNLRSRPYPRQEQQAMLKSTIPIWLTSSSTPL